MDCLGESPERKGVERMSDQNVVKLTGTIRKKSTKTVGKRDTLLLEILLGQEGKDWNGQPELHVIPLQALGRKAEELDRQITEGSRVAVVAHLEGREWEGRHFLNATIDRVDETAAMVQNPQPEETQEEIPF